MASIASPIKTPIAIVTTRGPKYCGCDVLRADNASCSQADVFVEAMSAGDVHGDSGESCLVNALAIH